MSRAAPATAAKRATSASPACSRSSRKTGVSAVSSAASHGFRTLASSASENAPSSAETGGTVPNGVAQTGAPSETVLPRTWLSGTGRPRESGRARDRTGARPSGATAAPRAGARGRRPPRRPWRRASTSSATADRRSVSVASRKIREVVVAAAVPALRASLAVAATGSLVTRIPALPVGRVDGSTSPQGASTTSDSECVCEAREARQAARSRCCRGPAATTAVTEVRRCRVRRRRCRSNAPPSRSSAPPGAARVVRIVSPAGDAARGQPPLLPAAATRARVGARYGARVRA